MALADLLADTVEVWRNTPGAADAMGNPAESFALDHSESARVARLSETDERDGQEDVYRRRVLYVDAAADILKTDRVRWNGLDWLVVFPEPVVGRSGATHHLRILIEGAS